MFQITVIAFSETGVAFCDGYEGCYHNTSAHPTGLSLTAMKRFITGMNLKRGESRYKTGIDSAFQVFRELKHHNISGSNTQDHGKSVNNNTVL